MRALPSQAFVAPLRISPARFCLAVAAVAALFGAVAAYAFSKAPMRGAPPGFEAYFVPVGACLTALVAFASLLLTSAPLWWALGRLGLRGWASSLLAGGALAVVLFSIPFVVGRNTIESTAPLWLVVLGQAPFGFFYGWVIWRIAFVPQPQPDTPLLNAEAG